MQRLSSDGLSFFAKKTKKTSRERCLRLLESEPSPYPLRGDMYPACQARLV